MTAAMLVPLLGLVACLGVIGWSVVHDLRSIR